MSQSSYDPMSKHFTMSRASPGIHELNDCDDNEGWTESGREQHPLPKADGGKDAWLFLISCFILEALKWGMPFSYGVFQVYYNNHAPFSRSPGGVAAIGTSQMGVMYLSSPFLALAMQRWPKTRRLGMFFGATMVVLSLVIASFCNSVTGLLATQSVMFAVGGMSLYYPAMVFVDEWFVARKGLAFGVMWAGTGSAGVVVPFLLQWLLDLYGFRTALRVWAVVLAIGITPCLFWVKGRLPVTQSNALRPVDYDFVRHLPFWFFEAGAILQSFAFFIPSLWLPSFAAELGLPQFSGPLSLAFINLATCFGCVLVGLLVDRYHISVAVSVVTVGQVIAILVFWGLASGQAMLYMFALTWGLFGGSFSSTWSGYAFAVGQGNKSGHVEVGLMLSLLAAGRGVGAVIVGPLSQKLLSVGWSTHASFAYGTHYGILIVFSGIFATLGGAACVGRLMRVL